MKDPVRDPEEIERRYLEKIHALDGAHVLEIGCGNGRLTQRYGSRAISVTGVDPEETVVDARQIRPLPGGTRLDLLRASATELPFRRESFTTAILAWSL
ncbi:MAG: class I SAM-dependent methyltransferase [Anaerolineales bacterium]|nr:class I SAM-dependent methyltransferase [Anaerolineales bacterium]